MWGLSNMNVNMENQGVILNDDLIITPKITRTTL